jgi:hypothetical protein
VVLKQSLSFSSDAVRAPKLKVSVRPNRLGAPSVRKTQANVAWDKNQYDDRSEVASYIWHNYPALFSEQDRLADRKVHTDAKAAATDSEPLRNAILAKWGVNGDPTIDQLLADGIAEFRVQAADRVLGWISDLFSRPRLIIQCAATLHRCQVQIRTGEGANGGFNATEDTRDERTRFKLCIDNYLYRL